MAQSISSIREDFDRIALLSKNNQQYNPYEAFLLRQLPSHCQNSLEIGCGMDVFSRLLAKRSEHVLAVDLSPNMICFAKETSDQYPNIDYKLANVLEYQFSPDHFDCIASITTLHHLPFEIMLTRMKDALKTGGTLVVLDLFRMEGLVDSFQNMIAYPISPLLRLLNTGRLIPSREVRKAWDEHGRYDSYLSMAEVRRLCLPILPGAKVTRHLLWRYSIVWKKPSS